MQSAGFWLSSPITEFADLDPAWSPMSSLSDQENAYGGYQYTSSPSSYTGSLSPSPPGASNRSASHMSVSSSFRKPRNPAKRVQQRNAANQRERKRMRTINEAFEGLRERIPLASGDRKLSKVDTLRLAVRYIHQLSEMVSAVDSPDGAFSRDEPQAAKVIIRYHGLDQPMVNGCEFETEEYPLYGHSLSWTDEKEPKLGPNNTLVTKLWVPEAADVSEFPQPDLGDLAEESFS